MALNSLHCAEVPLRLHHFKSDRDGFRQDCSWRKCTSIFDM